MNPVIHRLLAWWHCGGRTRFTWPWRDRSCAHYNVAGGLFAMMLVTGRMPSSTPADMRDTITRGRTTYARACAICHGIDGEGRLPYGPSLDHSQWLRRCREDHVAAIVLHGVQGSIPGTKAPYPVMAALGTGLGDDDIAAVSTYVLQRWGLRSARLTPANVAAIRARDPARTIPWTLQELAALPRPSGISPPFP